MAVVVVVVFIIISGIKDYVMKLRRNAPIFGYSAGFHRDIGLCAAIEKQISVGIWKKESSLTEEETGIGLTFLYQLGLVCLIQILFLFSLNY
ncbi:hypothetical protein ACH5RR_041610 [Cinchona calisaya]|uniref:Uncharacterized protein n=1 Tax=Cinchona calisaya TaxID=153742 RepID=A0ABD2XV96_9GENT